MRSGSVIVIQIRTKDTTEGRFVEHEHVVQALAPNRTNDALDVGPLPGGARGAPHFVDTHVSHLVSEGIAEDSIAVAQQVARKLDRLPCRRQNSARRARIQLVGANRPGALETRLHPDAWSELCPPAFPFLGPGEFGLHGSCGCNWQMTLSSRSRRQLSTHRSATPFCQGL